MSDSLRGLFNFCLNSGLVFILIFGSSFWCFLLFVVYFGRFFGFGLSASAVSSVCLFSVMIGILILGSLLWSFVRFVDLCICRFFVFVISTLVVTSSCQYPTLLASLFLSELYFDCFLYSLISISVVSSILRSLYIGAFFIF